MQYRSLSNGVELPMIGYGTFQIKDAAQCERCVSEALEAGYRLFDTAASYENEAAIGRALRGSGVTPGCAVHYHQAVGPGRRVRRDAQGL